MSRALRGPCNSRPEGVAVPLSTILIVGGSWVVLLVLTIWSYRRHRGGDDE